MSDQQHSNGNSLLGIQPPDLNMASRPCDLASVSMHVDKINKLAAAASPSDNGTRLELAEAARRLVRALETPRETMIKHCWAQPSAMTAITTGVDLGLFDAMVKDGGRSKTSVELASAVGADHALIARFLRHLSAMGYVEETDADEYAPTNFTRSLCIPIIGAGYPLLSGGILGSNIKFHEYIKKAGYEVPSNMLSGPFQYAYGTDKNLFEHLQANPPYGDLFNLHMAGYRQGRASWMDPEFFPVQEKLVDGADPSKEAVFLVDIGGSIGHDIAEFLTKHPSVPGRLILQDLPDVLQQIDTLDERIERMEHNFFTEQPIRGSRAYYMHSVLHDWPDEQCVQILTQLSKSMEPGYSKLLINENVIPLRHAYWEATALDILMMTGFSSRERTKHEWEDLIKASGLRICKTWTVDDGVESLIECELDTKELS
ncbi:Demethylsterigmatocystin 6-O-methyltransferase [Daldinia childiae]|uniref:Demethylsterigmatocystin 6-O-methyltransferase n=1 Tax=Daldinia childiae TaxID=326645 RepID=UPI001447921D|nr:Demethylsterigmatocystin 6-O-methyltransferase [Daldinia childiae]KAF3066413.1 Demethylsterigmatocystin 6-O-methyltransferase [Daldinia childiae]